MRSVTEGQPQAEQGKPGSDRNFGLTMAAVAAILGSLPILRGAAPHWVLLIVAAVFAVVSLAVPRLLFPLNYVWFRFGVFLHHIMSPIVIGAVFFLCVTPIGMIMRMLGKDVLSLRRRPDLPSYWIVRDPPGPEPGTMTNQF